jgi:glycosyltransferase involved in cell wall biosynthesis
MCGHNSDAVAAEPVSSPRVSVVIPVKDRRDLLGATLDGLDAQTYDGFEVIVVDDGSNDGSGDLARARAVHGRPVTVLDGGGRGAVEARLLGVDHARGEVLAFTDSDCVPAPRWLERAMAGIDDGADLVNGRTRPARPTLPLERSMGSGLEGLYPTCNVLYRRDAFERAGRFDRAVARRWGFRPDRRSKGEGFGEDTLLAWRVIRDGGKAEYAEDAIVEHAVFPPDGHDMLSRTARVAAFPAMVKEIPELRGTLLRWRWQLGHRTRLPTYLTLAALLTRRPWLIGGCVAWWAVLRLQELRHFPISWTRRLEVLPVEMGLDVVTAGALVLGSIRARSITL